MSVLVAKKCEFDSLGKILHQTREWIAALFAQGNAQHSKLVTEFSDPHWAKSLASSDRSTPRRHGTSRIQHHIPR
jgi:hypothetical protein